jgi:hypothetical protein
MTLASSVDPFCTGTSNKSSASFALDGEEERWISRVQGPPADEQKDLQIWYCGTRRSSDVYVAVPQLCKDVRNILIQTKLESFSTRDEGRSAMIKCKQRQIVLPVINRIDGVPSSGNGRGKVSLYDDRLFASVVMQLVGKRAYFSYVRIYTGSIR